MCSVPSGSWPFGAFMLWFGCFRIVFRCVSGLFGFRVWGVCGFSGAVLVCSVQVAEESGRGRRADRLLRSLRDVLFGFCYGVCGGRRWRGVAHVELGCSSWVGLSLGACGAPSGVLFGFCL